MAICKGNFYFNLEAERHKYLDCDILLCFFRLAPCSANVGDFLRNSRYPAHRALHMYVPMAGTNSSLS